MSGATFGGHCGSECRSWFLSAQSRESLQGPSQSPEPCLLATGRKPYQSLASRIAAKPSEWRHLALVWLCLETHQDSAWTAWTVLWQDCEQSVYPEGPQASTAWPGFSAAWTGMGAHPWMRWSCRGGWPHWGWQWTMKRQRPCAGAGTVMAVGHWTWRNFCGHCGPPCPRPGRQSLQLPLQNWTAMGMAWRLWTTSVECTTAGPIPRYGVGSGLRMKPCDASWTPSMPPTRMGRSRWPSSRTTIVVSVPQWTPMRSSWL